MSSATRLQNKSGAIATPVISRILEVHARGDTAEPTRALGGQMLESDPAPESIRICTADVLPLKRASVAVLELPLLCPRILLHARYYIIM